MAARRRRAPGILGAAAGSRFYEDGAAKLGDGSRYDPDTKRVTPPGVRRNSPPRPNRVIPSDPNRIQLASYNPAADAVERSVAGDRKPKPPPFRRQRRTSEV